MEDEKIIDLFFARSECAIGELDGKYGKTFYGLSHGILNDRRDAEECVNDAYLGIWNAIPPHRPNPLLAFACKIVRNCSIMRYRANMAAKRNSAYDTALEELENCLSSSAPAEEVMEVKELAALIEGFLDSLPRENRVIFMRRYWFSDSYADIARRTGISEKNVSVRLFRVRKQLKEYLSERGVPVC